MKIKYTKPEFTVEKLKREDVLLASIENVTRSENGDNIDFGVQDLFQSIGEDLFGS